MAPGKFGLFKGRSKEQHELPSTENLLHDTSSTDLVSPSSPIPSTSRGFNEDFNGFAEFSMLNLDSDDEDASERLSVQQVSVSSKIEEPQVNYKPLSINLTSSTTLQDLQDLQEFEDQLSEIHKYELVSADDATSVDANSLQFDEMSVVSEDVRYCGAGATKKQKKNKKEEQKIKDRDMWQASNYEVLQHLLSRSGTLDEQIKWEAIATARGLCTLTATCACGDCVGGKCPAAVTDGDGGLGAAPLFSAVSIGCNIQ